MRRMIGLAFLSAVASITIPESVVAQTDPQSSVSVEQGGDIVVSGHRIAGSAVGIVDPVAVLDGDALRALGATTMKDVLTRLKGVSSSATGGDPAFLVNGRRVSGPEDVYSLPPEAIDRTEVLSEADASRFGFPPTVRVVNFITKRHFRSFAVQEIASTTTEGGGTTSYSELGATRIDDGRRLSLTGSYLHQGSILQSDRAIVPDPSVPFAVQGNVTGAGGGSIDPALDALAGRAVTIAAVPNNADARLSLASYATSGQAATDIGPYRTLQSAMDQLRFDGTVALPIRKVDVSLNLSAQQGSTAGLNGLASAAIAVPAVSPALAFDRPVVIDRYFPGALLRQRTETLTLHGGLAAQGGLGRWVWSVIARYDRVLNRTVSDTGVPIEDLQAAIAAGGDPLAPLSAADAAQRVVQRSRSRTDTATTRGVVNGPLIHLPAGEALLTLTGDYTRSASAVGTSAADVTVPFARSVTSASAAIDLPIASAAQGVLPFAGQLDVNGLVGVSAVSGYGRLTNSNVAFDWTPAKAVQLTGSFTRTRTAPAINLLADPLLVTPNAPVFDYVNGSSVLATTVYGGNPALAPEERRIETISIQLAPFQKKEVRLTLAWIDTLIKAQSMSFVNVTGPFEAAFPQSFTRDASGTLIAVDLKPVNLARERERKLHWSLSGNATIGRKPPAPPPTTPGKATPPPPRVSVFVLVGGNYRFSDLLQLSNGQPTLNLLSGASLTGTGGRPRWDVDGTMGASYGALNAGVYSQLQGPTRIRSDIAISDLRFSGRVWLVCFTDVDFGALSKRLWAKRLSLHFTIENLLDDRINVRDRNGDTPNRFQSAYLDPVGRTVRVGIRKLF